MFRDKFKPKAKCKTESIKLNPGYVKCKTESIIYLVKVYKNSYQNILKVLICSNSKNLRKICTAICIQCLMISLYFINKL